VERVLLTGVIGSFCITLIEMLDRRSGGPEAENRPSRANL